LLAFTFVIVMDAVPSITCFSPFRTLAFWARHRPLLLPRCRRFCSLALSLQGDALLFRPFSALLPPRPSSAGRGCNGRHAVPALWLLDPSLLHRLVFGTLKLQSNIGASVDYRAALHLSSLLFQPLNALRLILPPLWRRCGSSDSCRSFVLPPPDLSWATFRTPGF